jgi:hypothetical protein
MNKANVILILAFPIVLTIGIVLIPVVADYGDHTLAEHAAAQTWRWASGHLLSAAAFGLGALACGAVYVELKQRGMEISAIAVLFSAMGAGLYAAGLGVDGIGPLIIRAAEMPTSVFFDASGWWVTGTFMTATLLWGIGLIRLVAAVTRSDIVISTWRYVVGIGVLLMLGAPAIPSGWGLYGVALGCWAVFGTIGFQVWRSKSESAG